MSDSFRYLYFKSTQQDFGRIFALSIIIIAINNLGITLINVIASSKVVHSVDWVFVGVLDLYCSPLSLPPSADDQSDNEEHTKNKENQGACDHCK